MKRGVVILLVFSILLTACTGVQYGKSKEEAATVQDAHIGVKGVTVNFIKNNPPDVAYEGSKLNLVVELKNEGAYTSSGTLYLTGHDPRLVRISPNTKTFSQLDGKTKFAFGGYEAVSFVSQDLVLPSGTDTYPVDFQASACYNYKTEARIPVCIDPDPSSILENEVCKTTSPTVSGGQGAPIAVTAVREDARPGEVGFQITFTNQGGGIVVDKYSLAKCPTPLTFDSIDAVYYDVSLGDVPASYVDCSPKNKVRMANGQGTMYCKFSLVDATSPAYKSILAINLDYGYLSQVTKRVNIKSMG
ncbi:hypothetical protein JXB27_01415 [Candidatus Woesearchaeota archaeon]|nr:hypothetical protein [Candidatus Woesearchaeota archaeon]